MASLAVASLGLWLVVLLLPFRPWSTRERIEAGDPEPSSDLLPLTILIPARNEESTIGEAVASARRQGPGVAVLVVDDGSTDSTAAEARRAGAEVLAGRPLPPGWTGKLWAVHQGLPRVDTPYVLLLDADIRLEPGMAAALCRELTASRAALVSVLARFPVESLWERLLAPAFVYFFKLLYPFRLANRPGRTAAAAGGCMLIEMAALRAVGSVESIRSSLIDDCTLARRLKAAGHSIRIGLTRGATSLRRHRRLASFWNMVARTAFDQLRYSIVLLVLTSAVLVLAYVIPALALFGEPPVAARGALALAVMAATYAPTIRFVNLPVWWSASLPFAAVLFLGMTWTSAWRCWRGERSRWKGRRYRQGDAA